MENKLDLFESVKSEALTEITPEILETSLDAILDNEVLKDIPMVGLVFKSFGLYQKISEAFFLKKLLTFLHRVNEISFEERLNFVNKLESNDNTKRAGEKLLITLNRLDDIDKSSMIGNLLKHTILGKISYEDFSLLSHMIDNSYVNDLNKINDNPKLYRIDESTLLRLYKSGFVNQKISDVKKQLQNQRDVTFNREQNGVIQPRFEYKSNQFAITLAQYGFDSRTPI